MIIAMPVARQDNPVTQLYRLQACGPHTALRHQSGHNQAVHTSGIQLCFERRLLESVTREPETEEPRPAQ